MKCFCHMGWKTLLLPALPLLLAACDSGDIYPDEYEYDEGITVEATFDLQNLEVFPEEYNFIFGVFAEGNNTPLLSVNVVNPGEGNPLNVKLDNIPESSSSVRLCLANAGRQPVYTFFEQAVDGEQEANIAIPETVVDLLEYDRIQQLVFQQYNCISCHQGETGAGSLLLTDGKSYRQLVGVAAAHSPKLRVAPSDPEHSFLLEIVERDGALSYPHSGLITRPEDINLLRVWIEKGAAR